MKRSRDVKLSPDILKHTIFGERERERGREGGREGGRREGERKGGRDGGREGGRETETLGEVEKQRGDAKVEKEWIENQTL